MYFEGPSENEKYRVPCQKIIKNFKMVTIEHEAKHEFF